MNQPTRPQPSRVTAAILFLLPVIVEAADPSGVTIVSPANGAVVRPGTSISVVVEVDAALNPTKVAVFPAVSSEGLMALEDAVPPYEINFIVPQSFVGPLIIATRVRKSDGKVISGQEITITVAPADSPVKVEADLSNSLRFSDGTGTTATISVEGIYADGVKRNLSGAAFGSSFESNNPAVATVDAEGRVQATGVGTVVITVSNSGRSTFVIADVEGPEGEPSSARDMTGSISISAGGFRRDPATKLFVQELTIRNVSSMPIAFPINLVVSELPEGVRLENRRGRTKVIAPLGSSVASVKLEGSEHYFAPGATATATLKFSNREGRPITHRIRLFHGAHL